MIILEGDRLEFCFDEVHTAAHCTIEFQRTLRIPDDGRDYPLRRVSVLSRCVTSTTTPRDCRKPGASVVVS